jgi:hypothetical protein
MIDINNEDMTQNHTFIHQIHTNDDTNMMTNDFDRYAKRDDDIDILDKNRKRNTLKISMIILHRS